MISNRTVCEGMRYAFGAVVLGVLFGAGVAAASPGLESNTAPLLAQAAEPDAAPSDEPAAPSDEPAAPGAAAPGAAGEPSADAAAAVGAGAAAAPTAAVPTHEPGEPSEPTPAPVAAPVISAQADLKPQVQYGLGVHLRGIFVPEWLLNLFLDSSTPLNSVAFGAEFVRRKGNFDIIGSIDFGFYSPRDGNYLGNGDDPATETDFLHFDGLSALGLSVHFLRHEQILDWLSFVWGGGVGIAVVLGKILRASSAGCNDSNLDDLDACHPAFDDYSTDSDAWLKNGDNIGSKREDSVANPKIFKEDDVPPVVPLIHLLVGFNFKVTDFFSVRVDGGFRNAFYVGATGHYFF